MELSVPEFYKGKSILITGSTGFIGKSLLEKLLRSCPDIKVIYVLLRQKKSVSSEDRLRDMFNSKIFAVLHQQSPNAFKKVKLIAGDITVNGLGISDDDKELLRDDCHIIFHVAACVRFDMKLKDAVNMNINGTDRMLCLAETFKNLEAFVHLSTAYCRCYLKALEEKLYPAVHKPRKVMELVEWMDDKTLDYLEPKMIAPEPNTYAYTKAITEELVAEFADKFPIAIARPSIVTATWKEPFPGWVDNLNGPTGMLVGSGKGVIKTMHCEASYTLDQIPVDIVTNSCILIARETALERSKKIKVFNLTWTETGKVTWGLVVDLGKKWLNEYPYTVSLWYVGGSIKSYWITHQISVIFKHMLPAYLIDSLLYLCGQKTFMIKVYKRVSHGLEVLQYYTTKQWDFRNTNFIALRDKISEKDNETFYTDYTKLDLDKFIENYVIGTRRYCVKEDDSTLPRAKRLHKIRYFVDLLLQVILIGMLIWYIYSRNLIPATFDWLHSTLNYFNPIQSLRTGDNVIIKEV